MLAPHDVPPTRAAHAGPPDASLPWWGMASPLAAAVASGADLRSACYRFGDGFLSLDTDYLPLFAALERRYAECAVPAEGPAGSACVRCTVFALNDLKLALMSFEAPGGFDALGGALSLLQHPVDKPLYSERRPAVDGWRVVARSGEDGQPVLAARGAQSLLDLTRSPPGFLADFVVQPVLALQKELLFVHAASVGIRGAGVLLLGATGSGKTTTSLTLAARGHAFLGDDVAAIRLGTGEVLPFRRAASLRPGPHADALTGFISEHLRELPLHTDGKPRLQVPVRDLFPASAGEPVRLRKVLILRRYAPRPRLEPFAPSMETLTSLEPLSLNKLLWVAWGMSPTRRLLQFILFVRMLEKLQCAFLDPGAPEETADLVEQSMEDVWA